MCFFPKRINFDLMYNTNSFPSIDLTFKVLISFQQKKANEEKKNKRVMPRDYKEWEK